MKLLLSRPFRIAAHYLHLLRLNRGLIIKLKVHVLDQKCPDFVAEAVGVEMTLVTRPWLAMFPSQACLGWHHFEA